MAVPIPVSTLPFDLRATNNVRMIVRFNPHMFHCGLSRATLVAASAVILSTIDATQAAEKKPNIIFIMGDDVGWSNIGVYHQGIMSGRTPNLDRLAAEGIRFTDYYAEASCTAGRA